MTEHALLSDSLLVAFGLLALPVMLFREDRARFYSYLHRVWLKTSDQPVWMAQSEAAAGDFF
ncbi:MAG: YbfA family protein [Symbiopectobacterium sp.]|uniref:YbfA family protein n=1 Tax=Symbiopectobacterium sp. TaxID=2952789 RepID=UPI0039EA74A5